MLCPVVDVLLLILRHPLRRISFGEHRAKYYTWAFIATLVIFAIIPLEAAVGLCDLFYALMAIPTMIALIALSGKVRAAVREHFNKK